MIGLEISDKDSNNKTILFATAMALSNYFLWVNFNGTHLSTNRRLNTTFNFKCSRY